MSDATKQSERLREIADELYVPVGGVSESAVALREIADQFDAMAAVLNEWRILMSVHGDFDEGCFYYGGRAAPELQEALRRTDAAYRATTKGKE